MDEAARTNFQFQKIIAVVGVVLMAVKFVAYVLTGSVAILTDALESIVNVVAAFVGLYALYLSAQPNDKSHPFGHGKIENVSATIEGAMILIAGLIIIIESIKSLLNPGEIRQLDIGLIIIAAAAAVNFIVGKAAVMKGKKNRSPALVASGKHLCSDTYSSIGILIGLGAVYALMAFGHDAAWLDSSIAIIFGLIISYTGLVVIKKSIDDTMDKTDPEVLSEVSSVLNEFRHDDWIDIYRLRMIKYGHVIYVDLHIVLPQDMPVSQAYAEKKEIEDALSSKYGECMELSMSPVPCDNKLCRYCDRNCFRRTDDFERYLTWTPEMLMEKNMHIPFGIIKIK